MNKHFAIVGPTASGKTALSIELAQKYNLEILSCDSVSVYRGLNIGSSKPNKEEQKLVKHHMIDIVEPWENYSVSEYEKQAGNILDNSKSSKLIVGGTGFYLQALIYGQFNSKQADLSIIKKLESRLNNEGIDSLIDELKKVDLETLNKISKNDKYRIIRALEVYYSTGKTMTYFRKEHQAKAPKRNIDVFVLDIDRTCLKEQIQKRTEYMFKQGIVEEVKGLLKTNATKESKSLKSVGYKEVIEFIENKITKEDAIYKINKNTYQLAKRQITWFKRMKNLKFIKKEEFIKKLSSFLNDSI